MLCGRIVHSLKLVEYLRSFNYLILWSKNPTHLWGGVSSENNEAFYFAEQETEVNGRKYIIRSYTYRLASYTDFQEPFALESRGTAFYKDVETGEWNLFCRAYKKFFNINEGVPKEDYIENNDAIHSFEKLDGSLMLFGVIDGKVIANLKHQSIQTKQKWHKF